MDRTTADDELLRLRQEVAAGEAAAARLVRVRDALLAERARLRRLSTQLARAQADVDRLAGLSWTAFVAFLGGRRGRRMEEERQQLLAAKLRHDGCSQATAALEGEERERAAAAAAAAARQREANLRYESALRRREAQITASGGAAAHRLVELSDGLAIARAELRELERAAAAVDDAADGLGHVADLLASAEAAGTWDVWTDSPGVTAVKHARLDDARIAAARVQRQLLRLRTELRDIPVDEGSLAADVGGLLTVADYFADGLLVDWLVQRRIENARERVTVAHNRTRTVRARLSHEVERRREEVRGMEAERRTLLG